MARGITVTGSGTATAPRDRAVLDLGVEVTSPTAAAALAAASDAHAAVRSALLAAGVAEADLGTGGVTLAPVHDPWPRVTAYTASLRTQAMVRDPATAGDVLGAAVTAGGDAARVYAVTFAHDRPEELAVAAREAAWADARDRAGRFADLAGARLGPVLSVEEAPSGRPVVVRAMKAAAGAAPALDPGEGSVTVSVTVRWALA